MSHADLPHASRPEPDAAPARTIRLDHASIMTTALERAVTFYTDLLGLALHLVEDDPIRPGRQRALLTDGDGRAVLEIIEMPELAHPTVPGRGGIHHLGFRLPRRAWHAFRTRLDAAGYPYQEVNDCLFLRDADGLVLEIEQGR